MNIRDVCPTTHMPASSDFTAWPKSHNLESFSSKTSRTPAAAPCTGVQRNQHAHSAPATALAYTRTTLTALPGFAISGYRPSKFQSIYYNVTGVLLLAVVFLADADSISSPILLVPYLERISTPHQQYICTALVRVQRDIDLQLSPATQLPASTEINKIVQRILQLHCTCPYPTRHRPPAELGDTAACAHRDQQNRPKKHATVLYSSVSNATSTSG